jgi:hypothetical protein
LPVVKLLALITDPGDAVALTGKAHTCVVQVESMDNVTQRTNNPSSAADRALGRWLPASVTRYRGFSNGAANIRAVGRLHLWMNYAAISREIADASAACVAGENTNRTNRIVHQRLTGQNVAPNVNYVLDGLRIYLVGTLCGGTCSGMAADLAYLIRTECPMAAATSDGVIGLFTTLDMNQARQYPILASNCRTALTEFDWFHRSIDEGNDTLLPSGMPRPEGSPPFDTLYVQSTASMFGQAMLDAAGRADQHGLEEMIALKLFMDTCAGVQQHVADWHLNNIPTYTLDPMGHRPRAVHSFGAAVMTYPKYRLATAAASRAAQNVVARWMNATIDEAAAITAADEHFRDFTANVRASLNESELGAAVRTTCGTGALWTARRACERWSGGCGTYRSRTIR